MWGSWTPAKLKMAVSGCPSNCAEATCKDIGVICVDSGFEIHFAGAAGLDIKGTEVLGLVKTEDEALHYIVALTQMYREQGRYLERIYKWAKRIGLDEIRRQIMGDADKRQVLLRALRLLPEICAGRPLVGARLRQGQARVPADGDESAIRRQRSDGDGEELDCDRRHLDIPLRGARCVKTPQGKIAVFRTAENEVFAIEDQCPHKGGPLSQGIVHGKAVTCPLHNWVLSLETGKALGADQGEVRTIFLCEMTMARCRSRLKA
jgi:NAD(P)H-dependent nitrite reductase small subunit